MNRFLRLAALLVMSGLTACAGASKTQRSVPREASLPEQEKEFHPQHAPARQYAASVRQNRESSPELAAWQRWFTQQGYVVDGGLSRVAQDALAILGQERRLASTLRDELMAWHGQTSVDVSFSRLVASYEGSAGQKQARDTLKKELLAAERAGVVGVALRRRGQRLELVVVQTRPRVELAPFPRELALGQRIQIQGALLQERRDPVMMVVDPQGQGHKQPLDARGRQVTGTLACDRGPGRYQVEWVASGSLGPQIVLNVPVYCGVSAPEALRYKKHSPRSFASVQELERESWHLVNQVRQSQGLSPLRWDPSLASLARRHSRDMERLDYVGHRSPRRGGFDARLRGAGFHPPLALENVASGLGPQEILDRLMASPGHRFNILNPEVTHLGVGVAIRTTLGPHEQDSLFLTQHFARWAAPEQKGDRLRTPISLRTAREP